jgi:hypothetical protein
MTESELSSSIFNKRKRFMGRKWENDVEPLLNVCINKKSVFVRGILQEAVIACRYITCMRVTPHSTHINVFHIVVQRRALGIFRTNAIVSGPDTICIFLRTARLNHSCTPNAFKHWNSIKCQLEVRANRAISAGDELCLTYISPLQPKTLNTDHAILCVRVCWRSILNLETLPHNLSNVEIAFSC